ncbi:TPA: hypothetical protein ACXKGF_005199, partial [Escherichia coli]
LAGSSLAFAVPHEHHHEKNKPLKNPPVFLLTQQTMTPKEALAEVIKQIPSMENNKKYEVRVEIKEISPEYNPVVNE